MVRPESDGDERRATLADRAEELDKRAPISVKFEIPYFTVSGIQVRYLKIVEKSGYSALPWVRYLCVNGDDYVLRTITDAKASSIIAPL
jgi:AP-1 complex subunit mu